MNSVLAVVLGFILANTMLVYECWVLSYLWLWFVSNPFGFAILTLPQIYGILLIKSLILFKPESLKVDKPWMAIGRLIAVTTFALVIGWLVNIIFM